MSFFKASPLPHTIVDYPMSQFKHDLQPNKAEKIQEANDEFFVLNMSRGLTMFRIYTFYVGGFVMLVIFFLQLIGKNGGGLLGLITYCIHLPLLLLVYFI